LTLNADTGEISGTPTAAGTAVFTVKVVNVLGSDTKELSLAIVKAEHTATFDGNGGMPSVGSMTTTNQKLVSLPDASRSKHSFDGWYTEKSGGSDNPPVTDYALRFEIGGGSHIADVRGTYNTYIDLTKYVPIRRGYTFIGWYSDRDLTNKVSGVYLTNDMTVYAGWRVTAIPQTGDSSQLGLWSITLCASLAECLARTTWQLRRRKGVSRETAKKQSAHFCGTGLFPRATFAIFPGKRRLSF
jgi:uncharacterized repeat protein (TIGR02543 family)